MAKKKYSEPMRVITFRAPPAVHEELTEAAKAKGIDLSSLINEVLTEAMPSIRAVLRDAKRREESLELRVKPEHIEYVYAVRNAGWPYSRNETLKLKEMRDALHELGPLDPASEQEVMLAAIRLLREESPQRHFDPALEPPLAGELVTIAMNAGRGIEHPLERRRAMTKATYAVAPERGPLNRESWDLSDVCRYADIRLLDEKLPKDLTKADEEGQAP